MFSVLLMPLGAFADEHLQEDPDHELADPATEEAGVDTGDDATMGEDDAMVDSDPDTSTTSDDASANYPLAYAARGLTMPKGMIRGTLVFSIGDNGEINNSTEAALDIGAAISPIDNLELGLDDDRVGWPQPIQGGRALLPLVLQPDTGFGDIPLYARYRFLEQAKVEMAVDLELNLPTDTDFGILLAVPIRIKAHEKVAIDTGVGFGITDLGGNNVLGLMVPVGVVANFTDNIFMKVQTGVTVGDLTDEANGGGPLISVPLAIGAGYSLEAGPTMVDLFGMFGFPALFATRDGNSDTFTDVWSISFGAKVYTPVLF